MCIQRIQAGHGTLADNPEIFLSTVHKAKGKEFSVVELADDYSTVAEMRMVSTLGEDNNGAHTIKPVTLI